MSKPGTIALSVVELEGKAYDPTKYEYVQIRHSSEAKYRARDYEILGEVKDALGQDSTMLAVRKLIPVPPPPPPVVKPKTKRKSWVKTKADAKLMARAEAEGWSQARIDGERIKALDPLKTKPEGRPPRTDEYPSSGPTPKPATFGSMKRKGPKS